jgi:AcrR family transcriptional regulator
MKRPTKTLLKDAAESLFAEKGYKSTSMEDISSVVGIRPSAIYKHFKNKQELYEAVLERMVEPFFEMLDSMEASDNPVDFLQQLFQYNVDNPNLARFTLHATMSGGEHRKLLIERWYRPFWDKANGKLASDEANRNSNFMALNNLMLGYITLAPLHAEALNIDPFSSQSIKDETAILSGFSQTLLHKSA